MVRFIFFRKQEKILKQVQDDGLLDGIANVVRQSVERLLRHVVPRNDGKGLCHDELSSASGRILKQVQDDGNKFRMAETSSG